MPQEPGMMTPKPAGSPGGDESDVSKNKVMAILAYIIFLIPLLAARKSKFAMYHTNQGFVLFLSAVAVYVISVILPVVGPLIVYPIGNLLAIILAVIGIVNAARGQSKPLPIIGNITLIKGPA